MGQHLKESHPGHFREAKLDESSLRSANASTFNIPRTAEMTRETTMEQLLFIILVVLLISKVIC